MSLGPISCVSSLCEKAFPPEATRDPEREDRKRDTGKTWGPEGEPQALQPAGATPGTSHHPHVPGHDGPCTSPKCGQTLSLLSSPLTIFFSYQKGRFALFSEMSVLLGYN